MQTYFVKLFQYSHDINIRLMECVKRGPSPYALRLISHILSANAIWHHRLVHKPFHMEVWDEPIALEDMEDLTTEYHQKYLRFLESCHNFLAPVSYVNTKGEAHTAIVEDILTHVLHHATHHRSQIISDLRSLGIEPPISDYIFYSRLK